MRTFSLLGALASALALAACDFRRCPLEGTIAGETNVIGSAVPTLIVSPTDLQLLIGTTAQLTTNSPALFSQVQWRSTQPGIAAVNTTGVVSGLSFGTALIVARYSFDTLNLATVTVTVTGPITGPITGGTLPP